MNFHFSECGERIFLVRQNPRPVSKYYLSDQTRNIGSVGSEAHAKHNAIFRTQITG
jgi:hypothetical protein